MLVSARGSAERALWICALLVVIASLSQSTARAQTWSSGQMRPRLFQIVAIDRAGDADWPYQREDIAGDGLVTFANEEASADLRTVYADATLERLWLRAYVASPNAPGPMVRAFFFLDTDARAGTGGPARGDALDPKLGPDESGGGYERAFAVRGDGTLVGVWEWSALSRVWVPLAVGPNEVRAEAGRARDPLALGLVDRGYFQVDVAHAVSQLDASCGAQLFVRTRYEGARSFGDDVREESACRAPLDVYGDPVIVRSFACRADNECPLDGRCREGVCLFAYDCEGNGDCPSGHACTANRCVRTSDRTCTTSAECDGLVCDGGRCVACAELGARACGADLACSPNGSCVDPGAFVPSGAGRVQGGAFHCAARGGSWSHALWLLGALWLTRRGLRATRRRS